MVVEARHKKERQREGKDGLDQRVLLVWSGFEFHLLSFENPPVRSFLRLTSGRNQISLSRRDFYCARQLL